MGLFSKAVKRDEFPWLKIESTDDLTKILHSTEEKPVLLFKHSTRCSISSMALNSFVRDWTSGQELCNTYFIDLLKHRDVSNLTAELTGVAHQSPQVIVIVGKEIVYEATHSSIDARKIESILRKA